jgi:putative NADH-flavin reductase
MRVAVFGSSGPTGLLLTRQILDAGHDAVAITRNPDGYPLSDPRLRVVGADARSPGEVGAVIAGAEAVVSTIGTTFSRHPITVYSDPAATITRAMCDTGVRRLVVTSSSAVADWRDPDWSWLESNVVRHILARIGRTFRPKLPRGNRV